MESLTDVTYHFCRLQACYNILKSDTIKLTLSSNISDKAKNQKYYFYLSTQRSRSTQVGYGYSAHPDVRIQLDGAKLSQRFNGGPIDYWGEQMGKQSYYTNPGEVYGPGFTSTKQHHTNFELEDRLYSYEPEIKNAHEFITRIDILIDDTRKDWIKEETTWAYTIYYLAKSYRKYFPVFVYDDRAQFDAMGPRNINDKMEEIYNNYGDNEYRTLPVDYGQAGHEELRMKNRFASFLLSMINIEHGGYLRYDKNKVQYVIDFLRNTGFIDYKNLVIADLNNHYFDESLESSCINLSDLRKLNSEYPDSQDASRLMVLGVRILKNNSVSSFDELKMKYYNGDRPKPVGLDY